MLRYNLELFGGRGASSSNSSNSNNHRSLSDRLSGDDLLDAQDMINELRTNGANVDNDGYVTLYHHTTEQAAKQIEQSGIMTAKEDGVFFTTKADSEAQAGGRGGSVLKFNIPVEKLQIDDEFGDEVHVRIPLPSRNSRLNVSSYLRRYG